MLKTESTGMDSRMEYAQQALLSENQVRYVLPRAISTCVQRHQIQNYFQRTSYGPGDQATIILNSSDLFVNGANSYLRFQCGVPAVSTDGTTQLTTVLPVADCRLGSSGALGLINRIIITTASGTEIANCNYINGYYQTDIHYKYDDDTLENMGSDFGMLRVPTMRSYGVTGINQAFSGTVNTTASTSSTTVGVATEIVSPSSAYMYNSRNFTSSTAVTTQATVVSNLSYSTAATGAITLSSTVGASGVISGSGTLPYPIVPSSTQSVLSSGATVCLDPSQSYYGQQSILPQTTATTQTSQTAASASTVMAGATSGATTTTQAQQSPYTVDTAIKHRWIGESVMYNNAGSTAVAGLRTTAPTFTIPLPFVHNMFGTDKLLPPSLAAGLKIDIFFEAADVALTWNGSIPSTQSSRNYTITNPVIVLDTLMMSDQVNKTVMEVSSKEGLDFDFMDVNNTTNTYVSSGEQTMDNKLSVSRGSYAFVKFRDTLSQQAGSTTSCVYDSMASTSIPVFTQYQWNLGGLYLPNYNLTTNKEFHMNMLYTYGKLDHTGKYKGCDVSYQDFVAAGYSCIGVPLERSSVIRLTGMPISSSRVLTSRFTLVNPYEPNPLSGSASTPSTVQAALRADMYLIYTVLLKIFPNRILRRV